MKVPRTLDDYVEELKIFDETSGAIAPVIFGGMAVNFWAERYLSAQELETFELKKPLTTKDLDVRGTKGHSYMITGMWAEKQHDVQINDFKWRDSSKKAWAIRQDKTDPNSKVIEITESIYGLDDISDSKGFNGYNLRVAYKHINLHILDPLSCLIAKTATLNNTFIENIQGDRQDFKHCQLLLACVPHYLKELETKEVKMPNFQKEAERNIEITKNAQITIEKFINFSSEQTVDI